MEKSEKKTARKKGDDGYWERDTEAALAAAKDAHTAFLTAEDFTRAAEAYFAECDAKDQLYGEAGLCLALSKASQNGKVVTLRALRSWCDGDSCEHLQDAVQAAYLRIQAQIETDPRYREKGGMSTKAIFLLKQPRLGGYADKTEQKSESTVHITYGPTADKSDFA